MILLGFLIGVQDVTPRERRVSRNQTGIERGVVDIPSRLARGV